MNPQVSYSRLSLGKVALFSRSERRQLFSRQSLTTGESIPRILCKSCDRQHFARIARSCIAHQLGHLADQLSQLQGPTQRGGQHLTRPPPLAIGADQTMPLDVHPRLAEPRLPAIGFRSWRCPPGGRVPPPAASTPQTSDTADNPRAIIPNKMGCGWDAGHTSPTQVSFGMPHAVNLGEDFPNNHPD